MITNTATTTTTAREAATLVRLAEEAHLAAPDVVEFSKIIGGAWAHVTADLDTWALLAEEANLEAAVVFAADTQAQRDAQGALRQALRVLSAADAKDAR